MSADAPDAAAQPWPLSFEGLVRTARAVCDDVRVERHEDGVTRISASSQLLAHVEELQAMTGLAEREIRDARQTAGPPQPNLPPQP